MGWVKPIRVSQVEYNEADDRIEGLTGQTGRLMAVGLTGPESDEEGRCMATLT
jgi:hypothetical protein